MQRVLSWLRSEQLGPQAVDPLPVVGADTHPDQAAALLRDRVGLSVVTQQVSWQNAPTALQEWRNALTGRGVAVFQFQIDKEAIRGFSVWDAYMPVAAVNTAYTPQARVYTPIHEMGHLLRRAEGGVRHFRRQGERPGGKVV